MEWWIAEAMDLAQQRAPMLTDEHAADLADDLYRSWPDDEPAVAVAKFFRVIGPNWLGLKKSASATAAEMSE